jgi:hypothetical protein
MNAAAHRFRAAKAIIILDNERRPMVFSPGNTRSGISPRPAQTTNTNVLSVKSISNT